MIVRLKVYLPDRPGEVPVEFQFYDSPIKRLRTACVTLSRKRFNSMIVRLKVVRVVQFPLPLLQGFNSMIVRLKVGLAIMNAY